MINSKTVIVDELKGLLESLTVKKNTYINDYRIEFYKDYVLCLYIKLPWWSMFVPNIHHLTCFYLFGFLHGYIVYNYILAIQSTVFSLNNFCVVKTYNNLDYLYDIEKQYNI